MYLNFSAIIQQQSDLIKQQADEIQDYRQAIDNLTQGINDIWHNANLGEVRASTTAQTAYFQPPD
jgi:soluble cytochrome b562